jgi:hypothetical protein
MYSSYSFTWGERSASRSGHALAPGKGPPVPIVQEAGWAPEPVWTQRLEEKSFASALTVNPRLKHETKIADILKKILKIVGQQSIIVEINNFNKYVIW